MSEWSHAYLESAPIWTDDALSAFDEALFITDKAAYFDDVACDGVIENFDGLADSCTTREELDEVAGFEDDIWVPCLAGCADGHGSMYEIKCACYALEWRNLIREYER